MNILTLGEGMADERKDNDDLIIGHDNNITNLEICVHLADKGDVRAMYKLALHYCLYSSAARCRLCFLER